MSNSGWGIPVEVLWETPVEVLDIQLEGIGLQQEEKLQRTKEWYEARRGRFTGSDIEKLMGVTPSAAKMEWGRVEKLLAFNETAIKYIYSKAKERQRGKVIKTPSARQMEYGTNQEPIVKKMLGMEIEEVCFTEFIKGVAGASPDGKIQDMALEIKCSTNWNGVYIRHELPFDEKSEDFWQITAEMLALGVKKTLYVVAEPSEDIMEPNITHLSQKVVELSEVHAKAMINRCNIGDKAIRYFLDGVNIHEAVRRACSEYEPE